MKRALVGCCAILASCKGCSQDAPKASVDGGDAAVVAEVLPRCRADAASAVIPGEDVLAGEVAVSAAGILVGVVRREGQKRVASVVRAPLDLASVRVVDVGPARGDDPPPAPRWNGTEAFVGFHAKAADAGWMRELHVAKLAESALGAESGTILEQHDESTAFDFTWAEGGGPLLVAWDEDAPPPKVQDGGGTGKGIERGFVKVRSLDGGKTRVASPETSDAETPRLLPRPGGFWLAWLAQRTEATTEVKYDEGPGEKRAFRWVEVVALDAHGEPAGPVRRASPEKGRAVAFELAKSDAGKLVVLVQDEAAATEGAGGRIVRHVVGDHVETSDVVDAGVGHAIAELARGGGVAFLAWHDAHDRAQLLPLGPDLGRAAPSTEENVLDGARVIGAAAPDHLYVVAQKDGITQLRRFVCGAR